MLDSVSRKPMAGVFVHEAKWGNYFGQPQTDSRGHFVLHLPGSSRRLNRRAIVQTVLYEGHAAIPTDTTAEMTVLLHRNEHKLPAFTECTGLADSLRMAPLASLASVLPGTGLAIFIENKSPQPAGKIRAIGIDAVKMGLEDVTYWLRIYPYKSASQAPGEDLLKTRAFLDFPSLTKKQWIDLEEYDIAVPAEGLWIELKAFVGCDGCWSASPLANYMPTGPLLTPPCKLVDAHNWLYEYKTGWRPLTPAENPVPLYHQGIQVELVGRK